MSRSVPREVQVIERIAETATVFTLRVRFTDSRICRAYAFHPGQFNMLYLHGAGEIPISIVSDPEDEFALDHTIRAVGRVSQALAQVQPGDRLGLRGPFGRGWPLTQAIGNDVVILTGGLGCAPAVSAIHFIANRRAQYGHLNIIQGVRHADDMIWQARYKAWAQLPDTEVLLAADEAGTHWSGYLGHVTDLIENARFDPKNTIAMICGPELMMHNGVIELLKSGVPDDAIYLSIERNMHCAKGHCGHCQLGPHFVCRDGPVFNYADIRPWFAKAGI
ncbi:MAG: FAD/NAD(P)-binding protein [Gammaproteobacteria bacterium]|nr:FAD/NAD(P)-binding protein [Gammaproteobacteria bacterium]MCP5137021.1 FAD/NAD(P)-binding protein [Gammaproteobacteria bacterium]